MKTAIPKCVKGLTLTSLLLTMAILSACDSEKPDPSTSSETGQSTVAHSHKADETCFICDPSKREKGRLWCTEHSRYEDRCWECQPQLRDASRPFCEEHSLYEDECHLCNPSLRSDATTPPDKTEAALPATLFFAMNTKSQTPNTVSAIRSLQPGLLYSHTGDNP